jgi:hypothetical protein
MSNSDRLAMRSCQFVIWLVAIVALVATTTTPRIDAAAATAANTISNNPKEPNIRIHEMAVDPFVRASPIIAAMVCNDGIALVATHIDEPLQFDLARSTAIEIADDDVAADLLPVLVEPRPLPLLDLPCPSYNQRIIPVSRRTGSVMMTSGWRADGHGRLLDNARSILARNVELFGHERIETLPHDLSMVLTMCAGSELVRKNDCHILMLLHY